MSDVDNCHLEIVHAVEKIDAIIFADLAETKIANNEAHQSEVISLCHRFPVLVFITYDVQCHEARSSP
jgi:hypothetical protein